MTLELPGEALGLIAYALNIGFGAGAQEAGAGFERWLNQPGEGVAALAGAAGFTAPPPRLRNGAAKLRRAVPSKSYSIVIIGSFILASRLALEWSRPYATSTKVEVKR